MSSSLGEFNEGATLATTARLAVHRSGELITDFRLRRLRSAAEAVATKTAAGPGALYMAGGVGATGIPFTRERVLAAIEAAR